MKVVIVAFNYAYAGKYMNGPGICLANFVKILKNNSIDCEVFTELKSSNLEIKSLTNFSNYLQSMKKSDLVIHWSGISSLSIRALQDANKLNKVVFLGPNLIDTVELEKEINYLSKIKFNKILTVNERLKFIISKVHNINLSKVKLLLIGPDLELWKPIEEKDSTILWKGNSSQFVKDVNFALELQKELPQYKFKFIGYPKPYDYNKHINDAKKSKIYISTSLSETMGMTMLEAWSSGLPSVSHPKIYMHGINYKTGIITNKIIKDYSQAIKEIMDNEILYTELSKGAQKFMQDNFSEKNVIKNFMELINEC